MGLAKRSAYRESGDPSGFAPDFATTPEPYGNPVGTVLRCFDELPPPAHVADFAGGYGRYAVPLAKRGHHVTILDCHPASLDEARRRADALPLGSGRIRTVLVDVVREALPSLDRVDAVTAIGFLHHLTAEGARSVFDSMTALVRGGGLSVIEFSTDKCRRYPDGRPILVSGSPEQNLTHDDGMALVLELYTSGSFEDVSITTIELRERQADFWYDARMIIAKGTKRSHVK